MNRFICASALALVALAYTAESLTAQSTTDCPPCMIPLGPQFLGTGPGPISNGTDQATPTPCDLSTTPPFFGERFECVEFINRLYHDALQVDPSGWNGSAIDYFSSATAKGLVAFENTTTSVKPQAGDIVVFNSYTADTRGHVAIVDSVSGGQVNLLEQNYRCSGVISLTLTQDSNGLW